MIEKENGGTSKSIISIWLVEIVKGGSPRVSS